MSALPPGAPIYLTGTIREIEKRASAASPSISLMELAGRAAAERARELLGQGNQGNAILVLAGPGNNGGDALVAARWLKSWWFDVSVVFFGNTAKMTGDAASAMQAFQVGGNAVSSEIPPGCFDLIIDGLFGIGLRREVSGFYADIITRANAIEAPVLALDIPSGLDADTGSVPGTAIRADETITFLGLKPGLLTGDGPDYCGNVRLETLNVDAPEFCSTRGRLIAPSLFSGALSSRPVNSHKGLYGNVGVIGGACGMLGAALLAGRAALRLGAGKVYLGVLAEHFSVDPAHPELMFGEARDVLELEALTCLVLGPGLGQSDEAHELLASALSRSLPLVLDADALNLISALQPLQNTLRARAQSAITGAAAAATILTPHPGEAARLLGCSTSDVQRDRLKAARAIADRYKSHVVLKGAGSICVMPDERWYINPTGNPGMAAGGMGDVLSGMLGALLARAGASPDDALLCGVFVHGAAADDLVCGGSGIGPVGLTASEVGDAARHVFNRLARSANAESRTRCNKYTVDKP
ncbi:MAG: NAD(P)H-hydrate dehydratase [Pseudomonadota bacterium]|nr:NAD(P)H-hydrate dehydratase [Burkholderiales bacterium]MDQ3197022.1 NAD(P)H-hydrate dehydratase [Pseudomonadota bacterium]